MANYTLTTGVNEIDGTIGADAFTGPGGGFDNLDGAGGNDTFTINQNQFGTIDGGADTDTVVTASGFFDTKLTFSNVENLQLTSGTNLYATAAQLSAFSSISVSSNPADFYFFLQGDGGGAIDFSSRFVSPTLLHVQANNSDAGVSVTGTAHADDFIGSAYADILNGGGDADKMVGGGGKDTLDGGTGADTMEGGKGNDTYFVDNASDKVIESGAFSGGTGDTVYAATNYILGAGENIEFLRAAAGNTGRVLVGNAIGQYVYGANGADGIQGLAGNDTLLGSGGNDSFYFSTALDAATNVDRILDFGQSSGNADLMRLDNAVFTMLGAAGFLNADFFTANADGVAKDGNDHIVYETDTGKLFYDSNGDMGGGSTQFATITNFASLTGANALSAADFYVY